ncbi:MAG: fibronectin type III domain-containing protein [Desulfuromonadaceae bacterium]|nr:fibronectin type III domain-containing protein [Desulfuromonadaceae bacterium]
MSLAPDFTDSAFTNELVVAGDEQGNAIFPAQKILNFVVTHLSPSEQEDVMGMLHDSLKLGNSNDKEKTEVQRTLGRLKKKLGKYGWSTELEMQFHASQTGNTWNTSFELCHIMPDIFRTGLEAKADSCYNKTTLYLNSQSVTQLLNCLDLISFPTQNASVVATAGNAQAKVSFSAPIPGDGNTITGYTVNSSPSGGIDVNAGSAEPIHTINGLINGTAYTFSVQAANAAGSSLASISSKSVTPLHIPDAPVNATAIADNAQAKVSFLAPESDGGTPITGYIATSDPSGGTDINAGSTVLTHTVSGLKNSTPYTFSVQATNSSGISPASSPSNRVVPFLVPGPPTNVVATTGNALAKVSFSVPESDGGSAITGYTVKANPPDGTDVNAGSTALTHTVTGLKNNIPYTFTVQASKVDGSGPPSNPSNKVTPTDVPGVPTNIAATPGNTQATVSFSAPLYDGGSAITGYKVTSKPSGGKDVNAGSTTLTHTVTGLKNGTAYTFYVRAHNLVKTSRASSSSKSVTPADVPGVPTNVTAASTGNARAKVSFSAPELDGGSAITGYSVVSNPPGGKDANAGSIELTHAISGLKNGTAYTFSVQAANAAGSSVASSPSNSVTPLHVPEAPVNVMATAGNARAKVRFSVPESDGGTAITGYTVTSSPSGGTDLNAGSTALSHAISDLKNGTPYTFSVQAANTIGIGPVSSPSNRVIPVDLPGAPTSIIATAGNVQAEVRFSAPESDGGSAITGYTVTSNPSGGTDVNAGSTDVTHTVTGLKNGSAYTFSVKARKVAGTGPASIPSNSVTPLDVPGAPVNVTAKTGGNAQAIVSFSAPESDGGSAITGYTVKSSPSGGIDVDSGSIATVHTVVGLSNGTVYTFSVQAKNAAGSGSASSPSNGVIPVHPVKK